MRFLPAFLLLLSCPLALAFNPNTAPDPDSDDPRVQALVEASGKGDLVQVKSLAEGNTPIDAAFGKEEHTPLMKAAWGGHLDVLTYLLGRKANPDLEDFQGSTALLYACSNDQTACALALIDAGANVNIGSTWKRFPLMYAAGKGDDAIVADLIAHHADPNKLCDQGTALFWAATGDHVTTAKLLLDAGAELNVKPEDSTWVQRERLVLLGTAAATGDTALVDLFLEHHPDLELKDEKGATALIEACTMRQEAIAMDLVTHGADIDATDDQGRTALERAGNLGEVSLVAWLKSRGAKQTEVRIIPEKDPQDPLPPAQLWALSVGAIYTQFDGGDQRVLGGVSSKSSALTMIHRDWNIFNKADLLRVITNLRGPSLHPAWDLCRASMLANAGYAMGFLNEKETWDLLLPIAQEVQGKYHSWPEVMADFFAGRQRWSSQNEAEMEACSQLLLNRADPNSPWNQVAWDTDLSGASSLSGP